MVDSRGRGIISPPRHRVYAAAFQFLCGDDPVLCPLLSPAGLLIIGENRQCPRRRQRCGIPVWLSAARVPSRISASRSATCFVGAPFAFTPQLTLTHFGTFLAAYSRPFALLRGGLLSVVGDYASVRRLVTVENGGRYSSTALSATSATARCWIVTSASCWLRCHWLWAGVDGFVFAHAGCQRPFQSALKGVAILPSRMDEPLYTLASPLLIILLFRYDPADSGLCLPSRSDSFVDFCSLP